MLKTPADYLLLSFNYRAIQSHFKDHRQISLLPVINVFTEFHIDQNSWQIERILNDYLSGGNEYSYSNLSNLTCVISHFPVAEYSFKIGLMSFLVEYVHDTYFLIEPKPFVPRLKQGLQINQILCQAD